MLAILSHGMYKRNYQTLLILHPDLVIGLFQGSLCFKHNDDKIFIT